MNCFHCPPNNARVCTGSCGDCGTMCPGVTLCNGRACHDEQAARSVAFIKNEKGGKWSAVNCVECEWWHVTEKE